MFRRVTIVRCKAVVAYFFFASTGYDCLEGLKGRHLFSQQQPAAAICGRVRGGMREWLLVRMGIR